MESSAAGTAALGLRLAGLAGKRDAGARMVRCVARGLDALPSDDGSRQIAGMRVPDGKDEGLRLAAVQALADLADPAQASALGEALENWLRERDTNPILAERQRDVEEMGMAALAAMGDAAAIRQTVDRFILNAAEREAMIDLSEHALRNPSPADIREQKQAREKIGYLAERNRRLRDALRAVPPSAWPALAVKASDWRGEFAAEALLLTLAAGAPGTLTDTSRRALGAIEQRSPIPAVRALCRSRVEQRRSAER
jgi:hypothetical protein